FASHDRKDAMKKPTIKTCAIAFGAIVALGFVAVISVGHVALTNLRVGGPVYQSLARSHSFVSDVQPPPEYIVEAYAEAAMALERPSTYPERRSRLDTLRQRYDAHLHFWAAQEIDPTIKRMLTQRSDKYVQEFWRLAEDGFFPALA